MPVIYKRPKHNISSRTVLKEKTHLIEFISDQKLNFLSNFKKRRVHTLMADWMGLIRRLLLLLSSDLRNIIFSFRINVLCLQALFMVKYYRNELVTKQAPDLLNGL